MGSWNRYDANQEMQPLAQEGTPTASCQGLWPIRFLISPRMETSQPSWATLCQCSVALTRTKCFWMFGWSLLYLSMCSLPLVLPLGTTERNWLPLHFQVCTCIGKIPWASCSPEESLVQLLHLLHGWTISTLSMSLLLGSPQWRCNQF